MKSRHWVVDSLIVFVFGGGLVAYLAYFRDSHQLVNGPPTARDPLALSASPSIASSPTPSPSSTSTSTPPPSPRIGLPRLSVERFIAEENTFITTADDLLQIDIVKIFVNHRGADFTFTAEGHHNNTVSELLIGQHEIVRVRGVPYTVTLRDIREDGAEIEVSHDPSANQ